MEEQTNEVFFLALGIAMFVIAITLLLGYQRSFFQAYAELYRTAGNEYVMPKSGL